MTVADFATKRVVSTTMILAFMVFTGIFSIMNMKQELIPDFDFPMVVVTTTWTGAAAESVKTQISDQIEEAALNVDGIKNITVQSSYGSSVVIIEFNFGTDTDIKQVQIQSEIDKIKEDLPDDADDSVVSKLDTSAGSGTGMALLVGVTGHNKELVTSFIDNQLEPRLRRNRGVGNVSIYGSSERQVNVELDPYLLKAYNLSATEIYSRIQASHTLIPAGTVDDGNKTFILKVEAELTTLEEIQNIIISNNDNQTIRLSDVAKVSYGTDEKTSIISHNGEEMVAVMIQKSKDGNLVEIVNTAKQTLEESKDILPAGSEFVILVDNSTRVTDAISNVTSTGLQALVISIIVLLVFLKDWMASLVVGMSIPISAMFTFFLLRTQGVSLNLISLMGLALAIGSLVDNAVVTLDNIFDHIQNNKEPALIAAVRGTNEVIVPMIASTATSVCVFFPILMFDGYSKEIFSGIALSMMFALSASIVVAMLFVPMASSVFLDVEKISKNADKAVRYNKIKEKYKEAIRKVLNIRWKVIIMTFILFIVVVLGLGRTVKTTFFPTIDNKEYALMASLPIGLELEVAEGVLTQLEEIVKNDPVTKDYTSLAINTAAVVNVDVTKDTMKAMERVRQEAVKIPNVDIAVVPQKAAGSSVDKDYSFTVEGENSDETNRIANYIIEKLKSNPSYYDIKSSTEGGYAQAQLEIDRVKAASYGIDVTNLTTVLNASVLGSTPIEITQGREKVDVNLQYEKKYRDSLDKIMDLEIKVSDNLFVRISDIATLNYVEGASSITTKNGYQQVTVGLNMADNIGFNDAASFIKQAFDESNPAAGYRLGVAGNAESQQEMGGELLRAISISIVLIYTVLAVQLESFIMPLIIMLALPLSMIGVIFGLAVTRVQMSMFVMIGILMLFGMAVNNAIVLLDFVEGLRNKGYSIKEAMIEACGSRLRPILMTTLTTVLGWLPMAFAFGGGSAGYYQGMAIAVMFGLSFCTFLTLFFIPAAYTLYEERKERKREEKERQKAEKGIL